RRRHTRSKRDWSSDVCSSDLLRLTRPRRCSSDISKSSAAVRCDVFVIGLTIDVKSKEHQRFLRKGYGSPAERQFHWSYDVTSCKIGRASCRERGKEWVGDGRV